MAILKKIGVKHIYARAIDKLHESILEGFNIDRIITPEQRAASDLVNEMSLGNDTESLRLDDNHYIIKFRVPEFYVGMRYSSMDLYKDFSLQLITAMRKEETRNLLGIEHKRFAVLTDLDSPDMRIESGDMITCMGTPDDFRALFRHFNK